MKKFIEIFGWYGMVAILLAYTLTSFSSISSTNIWYQVLNITGGLGLAVISLHKKAYQPATVNLIWAIIGCIAIFKLIFSF